MTADTFENNILKDKERIDDLGTGGIKIIISDNLPKFTSDAVLIAKFAGEYISTKDVATDLGSGTGILALMLHGMSGASVTGFEIQPELCDLSNRSAKLNSLQGKVDFKNIDYCEAYKEYNGAFTFGISNPPYFSLERGKASPNENRSLSRSMTDDGIYDLARAASRLIRTGGRFFMCYPVDALVDALTALRGVGLEPKRIRLVKSTDETPPYLALIESRRGGGRGLTIETVTRE